MRELQTRLASTSLSLILMLHTNFVCATEVLEVIAGHQSSLLCKYMEGIVNTGSCFLWIASHEYCSQLPPSGQASPPKEEKIQRNTMVLNRT